MKKHLNTSTFDFVEARISVEILSLWTKVSEYTTEYTIDGIRRRKKLGSAVPFLLLVNLLIWLRWRSNSNCNYILTYFAIGTEVRYLITAFKIPEVQNVSDKDYWVDNFQKIYQEK